MSLSVFPLALFAAGAAFIYLVTRQWYRHASALPPGPPRDPVLGHLRQMPSEKAPLVFHEWAKTYGDVMCLKLPGQTIIILDSLQAAEDLFEKRSSIYSDRPRFHLYELFGWTPSLTMMQYGKQLTNLRQMHQSYLSRQKCIDYKPMQIQEARRLVKNLLTSDPGMYESFLSRFATGIIAQIVAGHKIESDDDHYLHISKMVLESLTRAGTTPGGTAIDFFPFYMGHYDGPSPVQHFPPWFPGTYYVKVADEWRPAVRELYEFPLQTVKKQKEAGVARPSFILTQLDTMEGWQSVTEEDEDNLMGAATSMFAAGESTTWSALSVFILAMVLHPDCQAKRKRKLIPSSVPRACQSFRIAKTCHTLSVYTKKYSGVPHRCMEDDTYRGMFIPAGSIVFSNIRGMTLDENIYSNPTNFSPERYLPKPVGNAEPHFSGKFGFGRRICTGQYLAENSVWIVIATLLASCTIANAFDQNGNIIIPEVVVSYGLGRYTTVDEFCGRSAMDGLVLSKIQISTVADSELKNPAPIPMEVELPQQIVYRTSQVNSLHQSSLEYPTSATVNGI
ncbi:cytochrome P450 [Mycena epipterygia]|nr:cytochrome P450 [Mycena epipterygia]